MVKVRELNLEAIPPPLRELPQWVCWKSEVRDGKPTKVPYVSTSGQRASTSEPKTWGTFENAVAASAVGSPTSMDCATTSTAWHPTNFK